MSKKKLEFHKQKKKIAISVALHPSFILNAVNASYLIKLSPFSVSI